MSTKSFEASNFSSTALAKHLNINNDTEFLAALAEAAFYLLNRNDCQVGENQTKLDAFADCALYKAVKSFNLGEAFSVSLQYGFEYIFALDHFKEILFKKLNIHDPDTDEIIVHPKELRKVFTDAVEASSMNALHEIDEQIF